MSFVGPSSSFDPLFAFLSFSLSKAESAFYSLPGSSVIARYVKSSHQNDPGRTVLELILVVFAIRTLLQSRTRNEKQQKHFIEFDEKEIDELVAEWTPEPLTPQLTATEKSDLAAVPIIAGPNGAKPKVTKMAKPVLNLASYNFTGLAGNEHITSRAIETLRRYGLGSCGPSGFYGTIDVHTKFEETVASFLGTEAAILYAQSMATIESVIPAFCKRGDLIIADKHSSFAIRKGLEISRATVRWYEHNDLASLEEVLMTIEKEEKRRLRRRGCLSRLFGRSRIQVKYIVTEGIFERDGAMVDLPKLIELKQKYKYRLILDENMSFGSVGRTGRGLTELYNVPATKIDMIVGSAAIGLGAGGGFCAGTQAVIDHQRSNGMAFVFSASLPALLAVSATEAIQILSSTPSILESLHENTRAARAILDKVDGITIPSHPASPLIHIYLKGNTFSPSSPDATPTRFLHPSSAQNSPSLSIITKTPSSHGSSKQSHQSPLSLPQLSPSQIALEESILQEIVDEALSQGVLLTRAKRLRGQEVNEPKPSIKLSISGGSGGLTKKEVEKACAVIKSAVGKVLAKRR
ncbi:serine palmitoyltransferase component [Pleurotus pulmonarius]|nr:serine palmitoyltransferase component [Pleurotus pulmonarius]KAF4607813.1 serine palmitoyltransferase component [Pleurotus pulmonarius]